MIRSLDRLRFGPAGVPNSSPYNGTIESIPYVRELGLDAMEVEFVHGVRMGIEKAVEMGKVARENDIVLTAHAPYYINLNSKERKKINASIQRILQTLRVMDAAKGFSVVFHPAFYHGMESKAVTERVKESLKYIAGVMEEEGIKVWLRPELMGKPTQWGNIRELLEVSSEIPYVEPAIDFAHAHAREGKNNSPEEWREMLSLYEDILGNESLKRMHIHISGIVYGDKGEKHHVNLRESDLRYEELLSVLKEFGVRGVVISESPNIEEDALLMKKIYESLP